MRICVHRCPLSDRCCAAVSFVATCSSISRADEPLRWKFKVGEKLDYQMTQDMNMNMDAGQAGQAAPRP